MEKLINFIVLVFILWGSFGWWVNIFETTMSHENVVEVTSGVVAQIPEKIYWDVMIWAGNIQDAPCKLLKSGSWTWSRLYRWECDNPEYHRLTDAEKLWLTWSILNITEYITDELVYTGVDVSSGESLNLCQNGTGCWDFTFDME